MGTISLLLLGALIGMQHALEADHLAAVAALGAGRTTRRAVVLRGAFWGVGHTLTLFLICGLVIFAGSSIPPTLESLLELLVGIMIVGLGTQVLVRLWQQRPHFHVHEHGPGVRHLHAHSHRHDAGPHEASRHEHTHEHLGLRKAVLVGMAHGAAGSGGLLVLTAAAGSALGSLSYVVVFGVGSIVGMAALSFVASYPLGFLDRGATWVHNLAMGSIGCGAIAIGAWLCAESWMLLF